MPRRTRRLAPQALAIAALVAVAWTAACQDYNFSPVRHCLIQPGTERVTLSDISAADILFVVDDSGSMGGEQLKLSQSFDAFVNSLKATNQQRVASNLEPIDFHIAVTTTSIFRLAQPETAVTCSTACGGAAGQTVCCRADNGLPLQRPKACAGDAACTPGRTTCRTDCLALHGQQACCAGADQAYETEAVPCATPGAACGDLKTRYQVGTAARACRLDGTAQTCRGPYDGSCPVGFTCKASGASPSGFACLDAAGRHGCDTAGGFTCSATCPGTGGSPTCCNAGGISQVIPACDIGVGEKDGLYPRGDFVAYRPTPTTHNPRVIHFDKGLFCAAPSLTSNTCTAPLAVATDPAAAAAIDQRITWFKQNVQVGTCGSGQEQGLEAARRAIEKALVGAQPHDDGAPTPPAWPKPPDLNGKATSKLVVVFVGDEDDCSAPEDVTGGIITSGSGTDACLADAGLPLDQQRHTRIQAYADFLAALGRPVAASFIVSAKSETCQDGQCRADVCCDEACAGAGVCTLAGVCGGQGPGDRFLQLRDLLGSRGTETVTGSVCNPGAPGSPGFSSILERVAEVVKQPAGLRLPTQPANDALTILRIVGTDGKTRKTCSRPAPPGTTGAALDAYDWWFTAGDDTDRTPTTASRFVYLNRTTRACEANPGETYSADYLGLVPASGCSTQADCLDALGGAIDDWACCMGFDRDTGACLPPSGPTRGSCLCGAP